MGEANLITVNWPKHHQVFVDGIWTSFLQNFKVDVEVTCNGQHLKAHQLILAIFCPSLVSKSECQVFNLDHAALQGDDMDLLLEFIYRGTITLQEERLGKLQKAARDLGVIGLEEAIEGFKMEESCTLPPDMWEDGEEIRNRRGPSRRKRKNTPFKISQQSYEQKHENKESGSSEGETSAASYGEKHFKKDHSENNDTDSNSDRNDNGGGESYDWEEASLVLPEDLEEDDDDSSFPVPEKPASRRKPKRKRGRPSKNENSNAEGGDQEQQQNSAGHPPGEALKAARTEYKKMWRQNQPLKKCSFCPYETRDRDSFKSHIAKHDPYAERHVCSFCSKTFRSKRGFLRHQSSHMDPSNLLKCSQCDYLAPQKSGLVQHMASVHKMDLDGNPIAGKFKCEACEFSSLFECQLKLHVLRKHSSERPFKCSECEYGAILKTDLDKHISIKHRHERNFLCDLCGFCSSSKGGHNRHKRSHTGEKPFECDICGKKYADSRKFKIHRKRHDIDEKPFVCHICLHACRRKDNLKMHLKRIHKIEDPNLMENSVIVSGQREDGGVETQTIVIVGQSLNVEGRNDPIQAVIAVDGSGASANEVSSSSVGIQTMEGNSTAHSSESTALDTETLSESVAFYLFTASEELDKDCSMG